MQMLWGKGKIKFCDGCKYLNLTEKEQQKQNIIEDIITNIDYLTYETHFCNYYAARLHHFNKYPNICRLPWCKNYTKKHK